MNPVAVMDLGTNTFHLMVARPTDPLHVLHREKQPVKLGQGGINQGTIKPEAIARAVACMRNFRQTMEKFQVDDAIAIGTSALRSAANCADVLAAIRAASGIEVKVIDGDEEATYIYHGVRWATPPGNSPCLIVDIGGGSVECIIATQEKMLWKKSFDIGGQRLLEAFQQHDPIGASEIARLEKYLDEQLVPLADALRMYPVATLIGSSGTFDTLSEIHCAKRGQIYDGDIPETPLTIESIHATHQLLISRDRAGRMAIPGMIEMRVEMIVVASCLIEYLINKFRFSCVRVSTYSLKEGVIAREFLSH